MDSLYRYMLARHYSKRSVEGYLYWIRYYIHFHNKRHPATLSSTEVIEFLTFLAVRRHVAVTTQKIALNALAFLYNKFLDQTIGDLGAFNKASRQRKLPIVLTKAEVSAVLSGLTRRSRPLAPLLYGPGLLRIEGVRLRVNDVEGAGCGVLQRSGAFCAALPA